MKISLPPLRLSALAALGLAACVSSCSHNKLADELPQPAPTAANQELESVAKALAKTLGNAADYRQLLKAEALKKFDGDYDVLYRAFAAQKPDFGLLLDKTLAVGDGPAATAGMSGVLDHIPNLNISVPVNIDKWDAATYAPLVLFIPADFDEKTYTQPLKAYDKDGGVHLLDAKHAPDYPVVVVGPSERVRGTALTSAFTAKKYTSSKTQLHNTNRILPEEPYNPDDPNYPYYPPTPPSTPPQYYATCRTDKQIEYLRSLWMRDVSKYEDWVLGGPEVRLQILAATGATGTSGTIYNGRFSMPRLHIEDNWYCDLDLYYWNKANTGNVVKYVWIEEDGGFTSNIEVGLEYTVGGVKASAKVTYEKATLDDQIGLKDMDFDFCPSTNYYSLNGGSEEFQWTLQNRP